jgi:hypothetical protein
VVVSEYLEASGTLYGVHGYSERDPQLPLSNTIGSESLLCSIELPAIPSKQVLLARLHLFSLEGFKRNKYKSRHCTPEPPEVRDYVYVPIPA